MSAESGEDCGDGLIIGADDARLNFFSGRMQLLWTACGAQGDKCRALAISTLNAISAFCWHLVLERIMTGG